MPIPMTVGRWNKVGLNRIIRHIALRMPGMGLVIHQGRRTGRSYQTPVNLFRSGGGYVIALTYGPDTDWVRNVMAAGGCQIRTRGRTITVTSPRLYRDPDRRAARPGERQALRVLRVADFLSLTPGPASPPL